VYLLKRNAQPSFANKFGETPLHQAIRGGHKEIVSILLEAGADVSAKVNGKSTIQIAQENKKPEIVKILEGVFVIPTSLSRFPLTSFLPGSRIHRETICRQHS
jgi:hypothetical protein